MKKFCTDYVAKLDKPIKKSVKSLKAINSLSPDAESEHKAISI